MIKLGGNFYHHMCFIEGRVFSIQAGEYFVDQEIFWNFSVIAKNIPVNKIFIDLQKYFSPQLTFWKISVITIIIRFSKYLLISNSQLADVLENFSVPENKKQRGENVILNENIH